VSRFSYHEADCSPFTVIGLTLVVAPDSFFVTFFVVILFHQMFEGIALGSRIADLGRPRISGPILHVHGPVKNEAVQQQVEQTTSDGDSSLKTTPFSTTKKLLLAAVFAFITPIGMAIGIGVLNQFNGNDRSTIIAIATLDALSAGILVWVGVVEMWAEDWMLGPHAELANANILTTALALFGLVTGMVLMSVLGKWA
jgi:solute carrier family 39 (zinc transporter), member 1/2/3